MNEQRPKPWYAQLPAKLAAVVVFMVALTTLVGNVAELVRARQAQPAPVAQPDTPKVAAEQVAVEPVAAQPPVAAPGPLELRLDRIVVERDGSPGTTDWRFSVEIDDDPVLTFTQEALDDTAGRNVAIPEDARARVRTGSSATRVVVKGWRGSWFKFGVEPDAMGEGWLTAGGSIGTIRVAGDASDAGAFVFHFSTAP